LDLINEGINETNTMNELNEKVRQAQDNEEGSDGPKSDSSFKKAMRNMIGGGENEGESEFQTKLDALDLSEDTRTYL
jgi:hypothetical protein